MHFKYLGKEAGWRADSFSINIFDIEFNPKKRYICPIMYAIQKMYNTYYILTGNIIKYFLWEKNFFFSDNDTFV